MDALKLNPYGEWRKIDDSYWQFWHPGYAVYGLVKSKHGRPNKAEWYWEARVGMDTGLSLNPIKGYAHTLSSAQKIVETLCFETRTCARPEQRSYIAVYWDQQNKNINFHVFSAEDPEQAEKAFIGFYQVHRYHVSKYTIFESTVVVVKERDPMSSRNTILLEVAQRAIRDLFSDRSVSPGQCRENLQSLIEKMQTMIESLPEDEPEEKTQE